MKFDRIAAYVLLVLALCALFGTVVDAQETAQPVAMTPAQAIDLLDRAVATVQADRQTHYALQTAVDVIRTAIEPQEAEAQ